MTQIELGFGRHLRGLWLWFAALATAVGLAGSATRAATTPGPDLSVICDQVAAHAADQSGVPISVLKAISLTETGRKRGGAFRPWPWTVNMEGKGAWFDTKEEALAYVQENFDRGARSFDVGCFQINYKWHGQNFASIEEMFDPRINALYAARFLTELYAETGTWTRAAGAYHSRTPSFAERYAARFDTFRARLLAEDAPGGDGVPTIPDIVLVANGGRLEVPLPGTGETRIADNRPNTYPLLQTGGTGGLGSLVPIGNGSGMSLFGAPAQPVVVN